MDAAQVRQAFAAIERYRHTPCRECRSNQTFPLIYEGAITACCENCGGATRIGWMPQVEPVPPPPTRK